MMDYRAFPDAADGRPLPPMGEELMAAGLNHEDARFVARMLRDEGYYLIREEDIGWPEIVAFKAVIRDGQDIREDAGGFFARAIMALFGKRSNPSLTYQRAARALLAEIERRERE